MTSIDENQSPLVVATAARCGGELASLIIDTTYKQTHATIIYIII